jgi:DNA-directed RNA polymerase subunit M/transcription elongation factor TFIIS
MDPYRSIQRDIRARTTALVVETMDAVREEITHTLTSFVPEYGEAQIRELEMGVFNFVIDMFDEKRQDSVWGKEFETLYRRTAAEVAASLTREEGYHNGNTSLLQRTLRGDVRIQDIPALKPYEMRPEIFVDVTTGAKELEKVIDTFMGTASTMFECPQCKARNCTYSELQIRSADEGTTTFATCLSCATSWSFEG